MEPREDEDRDRLVEHSALRLKGRSDVGSSPVSNKLSIAGIVAAKELSCDGCELGVEYS